MSRNPLKTYAWRRLSARVVAEEPLCKIALAGCTGLSEQGDHIVPVSVAPELALMRHNVQGACAWCNNKRQNRNLDALREPKALSFFE